MDIYIASSSSTWKKITSLFVASGGVYKNVTSAWVASAGVWKKVFPGSLTPSIASTVTISRNNATYPSTLTGTNFRWTNSTSLTYVFQKSSDNSNFTNIGSATSIANPSVGSSNTVTYALTLADMPAFTSYYRFVVTAVNSTYSTSTVSTSTSVSVLQPAPINTVAPTITPSSGTVGVTQYSVNSNGTWDPVDTDGVYAYLWQSYDSPTYVSAPGTNTLSTYTPPSNFLTLGYLSPIRCRVTATNASGSTSAVSSNTAAVVSGNTVPGAPQNLARSTGNAGSKTFTWDAPASNGGATITSYQYQVNNLGYLTTSSSTSQSVTLAAGVNTFQVRAVNSVGAGTSASTGSFTVPTINSGPSASSITSSSASVSWTASNQSTYSLAIPSAPSTPYTGTTAVSHSVTGLAASTSYTPTLTITSSTSDTATTTGAAFSTVATSFTVTFDVNGGTGTMANQTANTATNLTAFGFTPPAGKGFSGWASSSSGSVIYTDQQSYAFTSSTTLYAIYYTLPTAPSAPSPSVTSGPTQTTVTISWTAPANGGSAITSYEAQLGSSGYTNIGNVLTQSLTGLTASTSYTYYVKAINAIGTSTAGSVPFTTLAPVLVPQVTQIASTNDNNGPDFMSFAITCVDALSCDIRVDRAASSTTAPTSSYTAGTSTLLTLSSGSGTVNSTTTAAPAGSNAWYRIRVIPYTQLNRQGTAGTQVASSWKRNTLTTTTTTNPSPTPFGDAST